MARLAVTKKIAAPPEQVFALATDLVTAADRFSAIESIERLTDGPFGIGTRWRETRRLMGQTATEELEVTAIDPPRSYTVESDSCGCRYVSRFECEWAGDVTTASFVIESHPTTLLARVMAPLGYLMQGAMRKMLAQDLADLRRAAEAE